MDNNELQAFQELKRENVMLSHKFIELRSLFIQREKILDEIERYVDGCDLPNMDIEWLADVIVQKVRCRVPLINTENEHGIVDLEKSTSNTNIEERIERAGDHE